MTSTRSSLAATLLLAGALAAQAPNVAIRDNVCFQPSGQEAFVSAPADMRVGQSFTLDLDLAEGTDALFGVGVPGGLLAGTWALPAYLETIFPPFGQPLCAAWVSDFAGAAPIDSRGHATLTWQVPSGPLLVGAVVWVQGITPSDLSNPTGWAFSLVAEAVVQP